MPNETEDSLFDERDRKVVEEDRRRMKRPTSTRHTVRHKSNPGVVASANYHRVFANAEILAQHGPVRQIVKDGKPVEE